MSSEWVAQRQLPDIPKDSTLSGPAMTSGNYELYGEVQHGSPPKGTRERSLRLHNFRMSEHRGDTHEQLDLDALWDHSYDNIGNKKYHAI